MLIRIMDKVGSEPPAHEQDGTQVWSGGYSALDSTEEGLPASVLMEIMPSLGIGSWYSYNDFKNLISLSNAPSEEVWTTLDVEQVLLEDTAILRLDTPAERALKILINSVVRHFDRVMASDRLWVRVE